MPQQKCLEIENFCNWIKRVKEDYDCCVFFFIPRDEVIDNFFVINDSQKAKDDILSFYKNVKFFLNVSILKIYEYESR